MKHVLILSYFLLIGSLQLVFSQHNEISKDENTIAQIPQESVFIHYNNSLLFSGENLYYSVYCLEESSNILSNISKVIYVELINENKASVFKHKLFINEGRGYGKYFIPSSIKSGNYKLIAYSQWMLNEPDNVIDKNDIKIINPFKNSDILIDDKLDSISLVQTPKTKNIDKVKTGLNIKLKSNKYSNREKVEFEIIGNNGYELPSNFSVSVKLLESLNKPEKQTSSSFVNLNKAQNSNHAEIKYLPEVRGEIISGKAYDKNTKSIVEDVAISLSIPGEEDVFKVSKTNNKGEFFFTNHLSYDGHKAYLQVVCENEETIEIELNKKGVYNSKNLNFEKLNLSKAEKDFILKHSFYNQISNAYAEGKPGFKNEKKLFSPFYGVDGTTYILDDYKRFPTIKEVVIEIIDLVSVSKENGDVRFQVDKFNGDYIFDSEPLILVDGVVICDQNKLAELDANLVKSLTVIRGLRVYGLKLFNGILSIETFGGNYATKEGRSFKESIKITPPLNDLNDFEHSYEGENKNKYKRVPDFRTQLYWNPIVKESKPNEIFSFWTSDVKGDFEISVEGFTNSGKPVSLKKIFTVE